LLFEHGGNEMLLMTPDGPLPMSVILPWAFGPDDLEK
jgi:cytidine deaminase